MVAGLANIDNALSCTRKEKKRKEKKRKEKKRKEIIAQYVCQQKLEVTLIPALYSQRYVFYVWGDIKYHMIPPPSLA